MEIIPTGSVVAFMGDFEPEGWLLCNGSDVPKGKRYNELRKIVGNTLPDLRAMFLRGKNGNRGDEFADPEPDRQVGDPQEHMFAAHDHGIRNDSKLGSPDPGGSGPQLVSTANTLRFKENGGEETRPNNVAVNWIIKI
ncbi:MAG: phage tail protein [Candidatus Electryonea clarkiae]|nr:phage tail protein [Candidatus Electryonea clarkiae]MDP8288500.1 phage tail protein [Candidatus Electryonea clarkiae]